VVEAFILIQTEVGRAEVVAGVQAVEGITRTLTCPIASVAGE